ncbi:MAG: WbqC family protein [Bacteroidales bacterium]|nr:WbqC family protein [Bacteroidales bacterium]
MPGDLLLSTAYLPPAEYFAYLKDSEQVYIEREESYLKQSYRNRCYIFTTNKIQILTVPVLLGSFHKTLLKDIRIDYSKRWQQVHLRAIISSYGSSPFFLYYFDGIEKIIREKHEFLLDLNTELLLALLRMLGIKCRVSYTTRFLPDKGMQNDLRYSISPKKASSYRTKKYLHVFTPEEGFVQGVSIIDLLFNTGPDAAKYL